MKNIFKTIHYLVVDDGRWGGQSDAVFTTLQGDFMRPRIDEVIDKISKALNYYSSSYHLYFCEKS